MTPEAFEPVEPIAPPNHERTLGHYRLRSLLGKGGMGEVYLAEDTQLERQVALKLLPAAFTTDTDRVRRFAREAKAASGLNHPNILTIHEIGHEQSTHFIATEYIAGETLRERLTRERLSLQAALDIALQIASALAAAHEAGIIHRDIKPENVMLRTDGIVKVLDFGLAKLVGKDEGGGMRDEEAETLLQASPELPPSSLRPYPSTTPGVVMGTASYMSPEQARGEKVDARSDLFSLGVVLYEMLAGRAPFAGVNALDVIGAILNQEPAPLTNSAPDVPAELQRIVTKVLRKERDERYQNAKDLLLDVKSLQQELEFAARLQGVQAAEAEATATLIQPAEGTTQAVAAANTTSSASIILAELKRHKTGLTLVLLAALTILAGISYSLYRFTRPEQPNNKPVTAAIKVVPFTSFSGLESSPAFSPDGNQIAFVWDGEKGENNDIYVKMIDAGTPLRLTNTPDYEAYPVWSPDGRYIAFFRSSEKQAGIFIVPALGGTEREVLSTASAHLDRLSPLLSWSSEGKYIVFSAAETPGALFRIFKLSVETLEKQALTTASANSQGDYSATFSPDGKTIAFDRASSISGVGDIFLVSAEGSEPRRLTNDNKQISGLAWSADGSEVIFSSVRGGNNGLWRIPVAGSQPELIMSGDFTNVAVSRQGHRLAYVREVYDSNIWRVSLSSSTKTAGTPVKLIASTYGDDSPQFSPDSSKIAFASNRTGNEEIWVCNSDGSGLIQLTNFNGSPTGSPRWSPDGRQIAFDSTAEGSRDIYVVSIGGGKPRRLTLAAADEVLPSWSRDGKWIYFGSNQTGKSEVWKVPAAGGAAIQVTKQGGREAFESLDGKFLYYTKDRGVTNLSRMPVAGLEETQVLEKVRQGYWSISEQGIYFLNPQTTPSSLEFFSFATSRTTQIIRVDKEIWWAKPSLTASNDGKWILWGQIDRNESDIMLMENFR